MSSASTRYKADAGSAEAEGTLQDLAPRTSVRSDAFDVGKQDMSVSIALRMEKVRDQRKRF